MSIRATRSTVKTLIVREIELERLRTNRTVNSILDQIANQYNVGTLDNPLAGRIYASLSSRNNQKITRRTLLNWYHAHIGEIEPITAEELAPPTQVAVPADNGHARELLARAMPFLQDEFRRSQSNQVLALIVDIDKELS